MATIVWSSRGPRGPDFIGTVACMKNVRPGGRKRRRNGVRGVKYCAGVGTLGGKRRLLAQNGGAVISLRLAGATAISLGFACDVDNWTHKMRSAVGASGKHKRHGALQAAANGLK
jgi:hypothetical protein